MKAMDRGDSAWILLDSSTGLHVGWYFWLRVLDEVNRSARYGNPFGLLLLDADTTRPNAVRLLEEASGRVPAAIRGTDIGGRVGVGRVGIILPYQDVAAAEAAVARILERMRPHTPAGVRWSSRLLCYPGDGAEISNLLTQDRGMQHDGGHGDVAGPNASATGLRGGSPVAEDWKVRILHARQSYDMRHAPGHPARNELAEVFRRMLQTVVYPAFKEVAEFADQQGVASGVECELGGVQPRAMFFLRPSGRCIRYELDASGVFVREVEGVYHRSLGQRMTWKNAADLQRQLTSGYARAAAAAIVQDHFRSQARPADRAG
jgi:GGDEF domain-containing protein